MTQQTVQKISLRPLGNRVVAKRTEEEASKGGILLPETAKQKQETAIVVAVGKGSEEHPVTVAVGDTILIDKYAGQEVSVDDEEYIIVKSDDIIAIVEQ